MGSFLRGLPRNQVSRNRVKRNRRGLAAHCMPADARFHPRIAGYIYKRFGDDAMDESFFPITWRDGGYRSPFIEPYLARTVGWAGDAN